MSNLVLICITCMVCSFFLWLTIRRAVLSVQERDVIAEVKQMYSQDRMVLSRLHDSLAIFNKNNERHGSFIEQALNYHYRMGGGFGGSPIHYDEIIREFKKYENKLKRLEKIWKEE